MPLSNVCKELQKELATLKGRASRIESALDALMRMDDEIVHRKLSAATRRKISEGRRRQLAALKKKKL